jgi:hypothetical protein
MSEKVELRSVARPGSEPSRPTETPKSASTISWRTISLISAPLLLGVISLVDAYVDKQKSIYEGDQIYRLEVESGKLEARDILDAAEQSGSIEKQQLIDGGKKASSSKLTASTVEAGEKVKQALSESEVSREQAKRTRESGNKILGK